MPKYEADIYYSGYIRIGTDADTEEQALEEARENAARLHNKREGDFNDLILPTLEPWREADTVREIE